MRVLVHDYSGHPFQVQLSRALARRGHDVLHVHCGSYATGKGAVTKLPSDPPNFDVATIYLDAPFERYAMVKRTRQELAYGRSFARVAAGYRPDVVLSSNDPLFAKARAAAWCARTRTPWVFWLQDVYSFAMSGWASSSLGVAGPALGATFRLIERRLLRDADGVVPITDDFLPLLQRWRVDLSRATVVENWAPITELPSLPRDNAWSDEQGLTGKRVALYTGTLGLKHNPELLADLAARHRHDEDVRVVVVSEGKGADYLATRRAAAGLDNLILLPYQPYERLPEVMATGDVLVALLEPEAGIYSVPSKILTYFCAGRAILAAMPPENLGARTIVRCGAGRVVHPADGDAFAAAAGALLADEASRLEHGGNARRYAERTFDIETIASKFEDVLTRAAGVPLARVREGCA